MIESGWPIIKIQIRYELDIVAARQKTRLIAELLGFDNQDQVRLSTAVSEIARNIFQYAKMGTVEFFLSTLGQKQGFCIRLSDRGPGIANLDKILAGTYRSETGMGVGLLGSKKLMDHFDIETSREKGTTIILGKVFAAGQPRFEKEALPELIKVLIKSQSATPFEEIQNQNRELLHALDRLKNKENELIKLNAELDAKAQSLQRATDVKTSFLSNMSHEIRTPLGIVVGFAQLAQKSGLPPEQRNTYLKTIVKSAYALTKLIGDILDLSKVESGKMEFEKAEFSMVELAEEVVQGLRLQTGRKVIPLNLNVTDSFPMLIVGDPTRVRQILTNLLSNALKFTEVGKVSLQLSCERSGQDSRAKIIVVVKDSGIGIPESSHERLFGAFMQADSSTTRKYGGTGLGLNLSRELAIAMGGTLTLQSSVVGVGSTFSFEFVAEEIGLDRYFDKGRATDGQKKNHGSLAGKRVLLVEDSPDNTYLVSQLLKPTGAIITTACDGREGADKALAETFDVILMDVQMPRLDGYGATTELRDKGVQIPIIALTANALNGDRDFAMQSGFSAYVTKPIDIPTLIRTIEELTAREAVEAN